MRAQGICAFAVAVVAAGVLVGAGPAAPAAVSQRATVVATDRDDGRTLTLQHGQRLRVVLSSTYWELHASTRPAVLRLTAAPQVKPQPSGCVPGGGCGTATAVYAAVAPGRAVVKASRTSCGEAMGCTAADGSFRLVVVVR
jgi:hypothetical protein